MVHPALSRVGQLLPPQVCGDSERGRITADLLASRAGHRQRGGDLVEVRQVQVQLIREARGEPPGDLWTVPADHDGQARLERLGDVDRADHAGVPPLVRGPPGSEHPGDDLQMVLQDAQALGGVGEPVAVGEPFVPFPSGTDTELHPPAAHHIHGADHLRRERRVAEPCADHDVTEADAIGEGRDGAERGEGFEGDLFLGSRNGVEMVVEPDRLESQRFHLSGDIEGPLPGTRRIPTIELAGPALGCDDADPHVRLDLLPSKRVDARASSVMTVGSLGTGRRAPRSLDRRRERVFTSCIVSSLRSSSIGGRSTRRDELGKEGTAWSGSRRSIVQRWIEAVAVAVAPGN